MIFKGKTLSLLFFSLFSLGEADSQTAVVTSTSSCYHISNEWFSIIVNFYVYPLGMKDTIFLDGNGLFSLFEHMTLLALEQSPSAAARTRTNSHADPLSSPSFELSFLAYEDAASCSLTRTLTGDVVDV